jgi:uncharacterized protein (TIGR03435 family)
MDVGFMMRAFAGIIFLAVFSTTLFAQAAGTPSGAATFDIADVHVSAHRTYPFMTGDTLVGDRFTIRDATMLDLIVAAYGVEDDNVFGGPSWLETDRFDVIAKAPRNTPPDTLKLMLQALLADRFKLVVHIDSKPVPAFVLTVGKGKPRLKDSEGGDKSGCDPQQQNPTSGTIQYIMVSCHNVTMETFADILHDFAGGYLTKPVVDSTGLKGSYDFDFKWTGRQQLAAAGDDGISIFDAVDKQLGLKLDLGKTPMPVLLVDSVNQKPTDNLPTVAKILPPPEPAEFDVAVIKPSAPGTNFNGRIDGAQLSLQNMTVKFLIDFAWDLNPSDDEVIVGAPKWLDSDHYDIVAKAPIDPPTDSHAKAPQIPEEDLQQMVRALLMDRFKLVSHMEDRPINAYTLLSEKPKLTKADPLSRTKCEEGPGPDGKDPRDKNPALNRLLTCQNMTMAQFAEMLQGLASGYIFVPVKDSTGLEGGWDFTLSFSTAGTYQNAGRGAAAPAAGGAAMASDPSGALSLPEAVNKQLGLKLEKQTRPVPVLVIDHIEEKPTDN